jgi:RNA polymerase sigma-70 factor (ECF subfamily)
MVEASHSTLTLLRRATEGDREAADLLFARYAPPLRRWAHGRLPGWARDIADTHDLVQDAMLKTFRNLRDFEYRGSGALFAYLRQATLNGIREELQRSQRRPAAGPLEASLEAPTPSPLEAAIGRQALDRYEAALSRLSDEDREAVIGRLELGLSHRELAEALGKSSADAARMTVGRALARLAREVADTAVTGTPG